MFLYNGNTLRRDHVYWEKLFQNSNAVYQLSFSHVYMIAFIGILSNFVIMCPDGFLGFDCVDCFLFQTFYEWTFTENIWFTSNNLINSIMAMRKAILEKDDIENIKLLVSEKVVKIAYNTLLILCITKS